ncbi:hypothetical protein F443_01254, partial [Phytophthora nicotianae P1569]
NAGGSIADDSDGEERTALEWISKKVAKILLKMDEHPKNLFKRLRLAQSGVVGLRR